MNEIPEWDGALTSIIDFLTKASQLADLSPQMRVDVATAAPLRFQGDAQTWWYSIPAADRVYCQQSWDILYGIIRDSFLTDSWLTDMQLEVDSMVFRQEGFTEETPLAFLRRRQKYLNILNPSDLSSVTAVARIIRTIPVEWAMLINTETCPDVFGLISHVQKHDQLLLKLWKPSARKSNFYPRRANAISNARNEEEESSSLSSEDV
jgi:hypothetical protein